MEQLIILAVQQHAWGVLAAVIGTWLASGLLNLVLAKRSQIDDWCESHPKPAAALKLLRGIGIDPWAIAQAWALARDKKLPEYQKQTLEELKAKDGKKPPSGPFASGGAVGLVVFMFCQILVGCRPGKPPCDQAKLAAITISCTARVKLECVDKGVPEDKCALLAECDEAIEEACK